VVGVCWGGRRRIASVKLGHLRHRPVQPRAAALQAHAHPEQQRLPPCLCGCCRRDSATAVGVDPHDLVASRRHRDDEVRRVHRPLQHLCLRHHTYCCRWSRERCCLLSSKAVHKHDPPQRLRHRRRLGAGGGERARGAAAAASGSGQWVSAASAAGNNARLHTGSERSGPHRQPRLLRECRTARPRPGRRGGPHDARGGGRQGRRTVRRRCWHGLLQSCQSLLLLRCSGIPRLHNSGVANRVMALAARDRISARERGRWPSNRSSSATRWRNM